MIAPTSFFSDYGGHIRIMEETLALQKLGHRVTIVTYYKGRDLPGFDIRRTAPIPYRVDYEVGSSRHKLVFDVYLAIKSLRVAIKERPDIIHAHMHEGALIGWVVSALLRKPLVFDFQGSLTAEMIDHGFLRHSSPFHRLIRRTERFINQRPDMILTSSERAHHSLHYEYRVPDERIQPLVDCVDIKRFDPTSFSDAQKQAVRAHLNIPAHKTLVVYLGLLTDYQGIPYLLQIARMLKDRGEDIHFLIMGFPNVDHYRGMARDYDVTDCVTLTGKVKYDDAPLMLATGDIAITAKISTTEGSGKILNYMALGLPVVAFDTHVHREYLDDLGVWVDAHDIEGLANAVADLAKRPAERERIGKSVRQRIEQRFTWSAAVKQIELIYRKLMSV